MEQEDAHDDGVVVVVDEQPDGCVGGSVVVAIFSSLPHSPLVLHFQPPHCSNHSLSFLL